MPGWFLTFIGADWRLLLAIVPCSTRAGGVGEPWGTFLVPTRTGEHEARRGHPFSGRSARGASAAWRIDRMSRGSCYPSIEKSCLRHGMETRRAETPDVALAAPFTTARPRAARVYLRAYNTFVPAGEVIQCAQYG
jgi:hypothetical protein